MYIYEQIPCPMQKLTVSNKRFLITWISINAFALFVNIAHIEGRILNGNHITVSTNDEFSYEYARLTTKDDKATVCLFMDNNKPIYPRPSFYPFTSDFLYVCFGSYRLPDKSGLIYYFDKGFLGAFNGYGHLEFIIYSILGIAIIYIPKLTKRSV